MNNRFKTALVIQQGACNPIAISRSLVTAIDEACAEGADICQDPAVRLIAHQLAYLLSVDQIDHKIYANLYTECEAKA